MTESEILEAIQEAIQQNALEFTITDTEITTLPPEIGQLTKIIKLNLKNNKLTHLPPEIGQLTALKRLYIANNKLTSLPPEIGNLTNLDRIYASNNKLTSLPPEMGNLTKLDSLYLSDNLIKILPQELQQLTELKNLDLRKNPLGIPQEIIEKFHKPQGIIKYFLEYKEVEKEDLKVAKVILVGSSQVGKTSVVRELRGEMFEPNYNPTEGLEIKSWQLNIEGEKYEINLWDFGSSENLHTIYQCGFSTNSIYLLITDVNQTNSEITYWLKMISKIAKSAPIILVGNKIDQAFWSIKRSQLAQEYPNIKGFCEISCQNQQGFEYLITSIKTQISELNNFTEQLSPNLLSLINKIKKIDHGYLTNDEYSELCQSEMIFENAEQEELAKLLHNLGIIIHCQHHPVFKKDDIIMPEWLINNLAKVMNDYRFKVETNGKITSKKVQELLNFSKIQQAEFFVSIIDSLGLAVMEPENPNASLDADNQGLIMPHLLTDIEPVTGDWQNAKILRYEYNVLPENLLSRLMKSLNKYLERNSYCNKSAVFSNKGNRALVKFNWIEKYLEIFVVTGKAETVNEFLELMTNQIEKINGTNPGVVAVRIDPDQKVKSAKEVNPKDNHPQAKIPENINVYEMEIPENLPEDINVSEIEIPENLPEDINVFEMDIPEELLESGNNSQQNIPENPPEEINPLEIEIPKTPPEEVNNQGRKSNKKPKSWLVYLGLFLAGLIVVILIRIFT